MQCAGNVLKCQTQVKYLGATLDQSLSGEQMALNVITKANAKLKFLYRKARNVDLHTKRMLVSALIQCHFDYASTSWYTGLTKKYKTKLQCTQNKMIRYLLNAPPRQHIGSHEFKLVGMLPVALRVDQLKLNLTHNIINDRAPTYFSEYYRSTRERHSIGTRWSTTSLQIPSVNSYGDSSFYYTSVILWNELPSHFKNLRSKPQFKSAVKSFLFDKFCTQEASDFIQY